VTAELAKAFEIQVKERFVRPLAEFLRQRGIKAFPDHEPLRGRDGEKRPIILGGQAVSRASLGEIEMALGSPLAQLQEFGRTYHFDLVALEKLVHETSRYRNPAAHETGMSYAQVSRLRNEWLGVTARDGGIFGALLPRTG
jgi:hypothetical protein